MRFAVTTNADDVAADFDKMADALPRVAAKHVQATADVALVQIQRATPVDTGELRGSWVAEPDPKGVRLRNPERYASFQDGLQDAAEAAYLSAAKKQPPLSDSLQEVP